MLSDEALLSEISMAVADEYEHLSKFKSKINVNEITNSSAGHDLNLGKESVRKDNTLIEKITNLTAKIDDLSSVREEMQELRQQVANSNRFRPPQTDMSSFVYHHQRRRFARRKVFRCQTCERNNNPLCNHCFICGSTAHRKNECEGNMQKNVSTAHKGGGGGSSGYKFP